MEPDSLDNVPTVPVRDELDDMIHIEEVRKAVKQMKCNKASGGDGIPAEVYKHGGTALVRHLHRLFLKIWKNEEVPQELKDASIVTILKKGSRTECGKILAKVLLNRLQPLSESIIPETQCGFRPGRGTTDMIFSARQVQEKCREQGRDLCLAFIDLTKAFDSVNREVLWACLARLGCPPKCVNITRQLHEGMKGCVLYDGEQSGSFNINTGVKQGSVIAPTLFSMFLAVFISLAAVDQANGVDIIYRTDGELFNMRRLKAKTKVKATSIVDLQYADDCAIAAHTEADLQNTIDAFSEAYKLLGLTVNVKKTKVLFQPAQLLTATAPNIDIEGTTLENVDHFAYLGSYLSKSANIDVEIQHRIRCACFSYGRLKDRVFSERGFRTATKILVYKAVILTTVLYGCETWVAHRRHVKVLEQFQQRILRAILGVHWQDWITNARILEQANTTSIEAHIVRSQLSWPDMPDACQIPEYRNSYCMYAELSSGTRKTGGQWKRYKDQLKANLKKCEVDLQWETTADDRAYWRRTSRMGVVNLERRRIITDRGREEREAKVPRI